MIRALAIALALTMPVAAAGAATFDVQPVDKRWPHLGSLAVYMAGPIEAGDGARFEAALRQAYATGRPFLGIYLDSPGGDLNEGARIASTIHEGKLAVMMRPGATCASACVLAFAAGGYKIVRGDARIGVHGASINGAETAEAMRATVLMARLAAQYGLPDAVVGKLVRTPASTILWLSPDDLRAIVGPVGYYP